MYVFRHPAQWVGFNFGYYVLKSVRAACNISTVPFFGLLTYFPLLFETYRSSLTVA